MTGLVSDALIGIGMKRILDSFGIHFNIPRPFETKDEKILRENKEEFLKYYYNDLIQGVAP